MKSPKNLSEFKSALAADRSTIRRLGRTEKVFGSIGALDAAERRPEFPTLIAAIGLEFANEGYRSKFTVDNGRFGIAARRGGGSEIPAWPNNGAHARTRRPLEERADGACSSAPPGIGVFAVMVLLDLLQRYLHHLIGCRWFA
jgi:hypothetical protein